jgi:hypothetical protein
MSYSYIRILYVEVSCEQALARCLKEAGRLLEEQSLGNESFISNATCEGARAHHRCDRDRPRETIQVELE